MNREELNILYKFFNTRAKVNVLGMSDYGAVIYLINKDLNIVEDLNNNALSCLDYVLQHLHVSQEACYDAVVCILQTLKELDEKYDRDNIKVDMLLRLVKEKLNIE